MQQKSKQRSNLDRRKTLLFSEFSSLIVPPLLHTATMSWLTKPYHPICSNLDLEAREASSPVKGLRATKLS